MILRSKELTMNKYKLKNTADFDAKQNSYSDIVFHK